MHRRCACCPEEFVPEHGNQIYCSRRCKRRARKMRRQARKPTIISL